MAQESPLQQAEEPFSESPDSRRRSIEVLDAAIGRLAARMNAVCYEQLVLIREFDERLGWTRWA